MGKRRFDYDRIQQADLVITAMQIAEANGGAIDTTALKAIMVKKFHPSGRDAAQNANWQMNFEQIVGNLISNKAMPESMFSKGYAVDTDDGFALTDKGIRFLAEVPH